MGLAFRALGEPQRRILQERLVESPRRMDRAGQRRLRRARLPGSAPSICGSTKRWPRNERGSRRSRDCRLRDHIAVPRTPSAGARRCSTRRLSAASRRPTSRLRIRRNSRGWRLNQRPGGVLFASQKSIWHACFRYLRLVVGIFASRERPSYDDYVSGAETSDVEVEPGRILHLVCR